MIERYLRQLCLEQIGERGQKSLHGASIIVVGAGGLGSPALTYLAAAGIGEITLVDADTVEISNLNRQFLHNEQDIGREKTYSAKEKLCAQNSDITVRGLHTCLTAENATSILQGHNLVLGAVDCFSTRSVINRACMMLRIPYVDGGVNGFSGSVIFSNPPDTPCLNCVFPKESKSLNPVGVLGTTAGNIGTAMANVAILHLLGLPNPLVGRLFLYDGLRMKTDLLDIARNDACLVCKQF